MLQLLARTRFFGDGHPLSGLDPRGARRGLPRPQPSSARLRRSRARRRAQPLAAARRSAARPSPSARRPRLSPRRTSGAARPGTRGTTDALHERVRQRPLHRQAARSTSSASGGSGSSSRSCSWCARPSCRCSRRGFTSASSSRGGSQFTIEAPSNTRPERSRRRAVHVGPTPSITTSVTVGSNRVPRADRPAVGRPRPRQVAAALAKAYGVADRRR